MIFKRRRFHVAHRICRQQRIAEKKSQHSSKALSVDSVTEEKLGNEGRHAIGHVDRIVPSLGNAEAIGDKTAEDHGDSTANQLAAPLGRLEKISQAIFPRAVKGDLVAVGLAVEIEKSRAQLLELDLRKRQADSESKRVEEDFSAASGIHSDLRSASSEDPGRRERATLSRIPKIK